MDQPTRAECSDCGWRSPYTSHGIMTYMRRDIHAAFAGHYVRVVSAPEPEGDE